MDPITVTHLVQDRTDDLQRLADQVRRERSLRSTTPAKSTPSPAGPSEARRAVAPAPTKAGGCAPAEPAT